MSFSLTDADKVSHILRRLGFGASLPDLQEVAGLSPDQVVDRMLDIKPTDGVLDPIRFAFLKGEEAQPGGYRFRQFWFYEMLTTKQPLREKLSLFWHNHFAVSENKVEDGLSILDYLQSIRKNPTGKFGDLLKQMVRSVALMKELDVQMVSKAKPNENFARELLELYTLGEGNYTETDIQELSKLLTGWGYIDTFWGLGDNNDKRLKAMLENGNMPSAFCYVPAFHDDTPRTVLGKKVNDPDEVLEMLATHPKTAEFVCTKLWKWFGADHVEKGAVDAMVKAWRKSGGHIGTVLKEMTRTKEFWSEQVHRGLTKNPVDFVIGTCRAQNMAAALTERAKPATKTDPVPKELDDHIGASVWHTVGIGMDVLYMPTVAGYAGGSDWVNAQATVAKMRFEGIMTWESYQEGKETKWKAGPPLTYVSEVVRKANPKTVREYSHAICRVYDVKLDEQQLKALDDLITKTGGLEPLKNPAWHAGHVNELFKMIRMTPQYSIC